MEAYGSQRNREALDSYKIIYMPVNHGESASRQTDEEPANEAEDVP